jgi:LPS-assembly lipoprotein
MSWSDGVAAGRRSALAALLLLAPLALSGCGFRPVYGDAAVSRGLDDKTGLSLGGVEIQNIPDRIGQELRNRLIDRFYGESRPSAARYTLKIVLTTNVEKLGIQKDSSATRAELTMAAHYTLSDAAKHYSLADGTSRTVVSYNFLSNDYASVASGNDATERALDDVADDVTQRIALALIRFEDDQKNNAANPVPTLAPQTSKPETLPPAPPSGPNPGHPAGGSLNLP